MAEKVSDVPDTTEEIVGLQEYLKTVSKILKKNQSKNDCHQQHWYLGTLSHHFAFGRYRAGS